MAKPKRKSGPAPLPADQIRRHVIGVYLSDIERRDLEALAVPGGTAELSELAVRRRLAAHLRSSGLETYPPSAPPMVPEINNDAWDSLARVVGNLNQYQRAINEGRATGYPPETLEELVELVEELRAQLMGATVYDDEDDETKN